LDANVNGGVRRREYPAVRRGERREVITAHSKRKSNVKDVVVAKGNRRRQMEEKEGAAKRFESYGSVADAWGLATSEAMRYGQ